MLVESEKLLKAISFIGKDENLRNKFIELCREVEKTLDFPEGDIRYNVTGHIADALYSEVGVVHKTLENGIIFEFVYGSKIAREFVLSKKENPNHVWEPQTTKLLLLLAKYAKQVLIGGAYFGDHAILVANQINKNGGICHAFEPNKIHSEMLKRNAEINNLPNLKVNQMGLWKSDSANLQFVGDDALAASEEISAQTEDSFQSTTIDSYLKANGIPSVDLVMIDIEGGEFNALQGAEEQLALPVGTAPNVVFEIHSLYTDWSQGLQNADVVRYLTSFGYKIFAVRDIHSNYDFGSLPIEITPADKTYIDGPPHGFNMLAVKDETILAASDFRICEDVSPKYLLHKNSPLFRPLEQENYGFGND